MTLRVLQLSPLEATVWDASGQMGSQWAEQRLLAGATPSGLPGMPEGPPPLASTFPHRSASNRAGWQLPPLQPSPFQVCGRISGEGDGKRGKS